MITEENLTHNNEQEEPSINDVQWKLYTLIKHNSLIEHRKTTQKEICDAFPYHKYGNPEGYTYSDRPHSSDKCTKIWHDINAINNDPQLDKFIITEKYEYWIGSEEEAKNYVKRLWRQYISPKLSRYWNMKDKADRNGEGKLFGSRLDPIDDDSKARRFREAFNDYDITMQEEAKGDEGR